MSRERVALVLGLFALLSSVLIALWTAASPVVPDGLGTSSEAVSGGQDRACEALLKSGPVAQIVRSRPAANRLFVDEEAWSALPKDSRRLLVSTVRCAAAREGGDYAVVYAAGTGRRLALAGSRGVILD